MTMAVHTEKATLEDWILALICATQEERRNIGIKGLDAGIALSGVVCLVHGRTFTWVSAVRHVMETEAEYAREHADEDGPNAQLHRIGALRPATVHDAPSNLPWDIARCRSCGAEIVWAKTQNGKNIPIDAQSHESGNIMLVAASSTILEPPYAVILRTVADMAGVPPEKLHRTHFATCPKAADWRRSP